MPARAKVKRCCFLSQINSSVNPRFSGCVFALSESAFKKSASKSEATSLGCTGANATRPFSVATSTIGSNQ